jgi:hypothetical protein
MGFRFRSALGCRPDEIKKRLELFGMKSIDSEK